MLTSLSRYAISFLLPGLVLTAISPVSAQDQLLPVFHFNHLSTADGLSSNAMRSRVVRDNNGFVWIGTVNGLERYDGISIKDYRNVPSDPYSLSSNTIMSLLVDRKHRLWVGTFETGLSLYDAARDCFLNLFPRPGDSLWLQGKSIVALMDDRSGNVWLGTDYGGVACVKIPENVESGDPDSLLSRFRFRTYSLGTPINSARGLFEREDGKILVASDSGAIILDPTNGALLRQYLDDSLGRRLETLSLHAILQDQRGNLWVGSGTEGVFKLEAKGGRVLNYRHGDKDGLSISSDYVMDIVEDRGGNLWIATQIGLDLFTPVIEKCRPYLTFDRTPRMSFMNELSVDRTGTLWISTGEDGVYWLSPKSQRFPNYSMREGGGSPKLFETIERSNDGTFWCSSYGKLFQIDITTNRVLKAIDVFRGKTETFWQPDNSTTFLDDRGDFWYGTWGLGLYRINLATGQVKNYGYESSGRREPIAMSIAQGFGDTIWTSAYRDGVMKFDPASGTFLTLPIPNFRFPFHVMNDRDGKIWISSEENGVCVYNPATGMTDRFVHDPSNPHSLSNDRARKTYQDPLGRVWVAAGNVVNLWDQATRSFARYPNSAFKQSLLVTPIGSDRKGRLWSQYINGGLSILDTASSSYTNFDASDGVCGHVVDMETLDDGRVLLAGSKGLNILNPDSIEFHRAPPPLLITRMAINDEQVPIPALVNGIGLLHLSHIQNVLEFEFADNDIDAPHLVQYQYQLEGIDGGWVKPKDRRYVRYPSLPPGDYVFKVRAATSGGEWPDQEIALAVSIAPPWWRTTWAYAAYILLIVGLVFAGYRVRLRQVHLQQEVEMEHFEREHLEEVDRLKSRFFANISHEFRTPLTLILGPIRNWRENAHDEKEARDFGMAERNALRLLGLINQLLDLSKLEAGAMKLRTSRMNIVPLVKGIVYSFESSAGMRGVTLAVEVEQEEIEIYCDKEMLEKILNNLLSNAFKFTPAGGKVTVQIAHLTSPIPHHVSLSVADTGIGIPANQLDKVFDRFYQVDASQTREHEGSGLGLALVKELVELHHGTIQVQSEVGRGATFTVRFPLGRSHLKDDEIVDVSVSAKSTPHGVHVADADKPVGEAREETESEKPNGEKPIVLIVEDNADVRGYIKDYLVPAYHVKEARDGAEGIETALEVIPDLIISDVMMPKKDGYEVCKILKRDEKTSHIPIILLTAKAAIENKIEGLEIGADDYLIKPFEPKELLARVKNLIDLRRKLRERFKASVPLKPGEVAVTSMDDAFLRKVMTAVEQHIGDESFSVEELCNEVGMSRVQLHRKLTALTNQTGSEFIRYMRLHRAMELLQKNAGTVSEIAYMVGFGKPSNLAKWFQEQFGILPSEVRKEALAKGTK
jgi:signal transduction histidine kinase/ligand-binding sensor domain-containing protein/DNA-binding response OmpR family regulator